MVSKQNLFGIVFSSSYYSDFSQGDHVIDLSMKNIQVVRLYKIIWD